MYKNNIEIALKNDKLAKFGIIELLIVPIEYYYFDCIAEIHAEIENYISETYGISLQYGKDYEITDDGREAIDDIMANS